MLKSTVLEPFPFSSFTFVLACRAVALAKAGTTVF